MEAAPATTAQIIRAYRLVCPGAARWVKISDLVDHLDIPLDEIKATLKAMYRDGRAELIPEDQISVGPDRVSDWDAECAPFVGCEFKHRVSIV